MGARGMRWWAGLSLAALVLVSCSDGEDGPDGEGTGAGPSTSSEPSGSAEPTTRAAEASESATEPAPGPTPWPEPTRPAAMERDDIEGAKAAAEYFLALYPYVYATGDFDAWNAISHPDCAFCSGVVANVEELQSKNEYVDGPRIRIQSVEGALPDEDYEYFSVWVEAQEEAFSRYGRSGEPIEEMSSSLVEVDFALMQEDGAWLVRGAVGRNLDRDANGV